MKISGVCAFTLVELLAVIALLAGFAAAAGLALRHPGESVALQSAQGMVAGLLNAARGRAALTGQNARLVVSADSGESRDFLRWLQVVHEDPAAPGDWLATDGGIQLPRGINVVPPSVAAVPGNPFWPSSRRSTAFASSAQAMTINGSSAGAFYHVQFTPRGTTSGGKVVLTAGRFDTETSLVFDNPDNVRGLLLRPTGALTLLDDPGAFGP